MPQWIPELLPHAVRDSFKWEIAQELGIADQVREQGWPSTSSRNCGRVGGRIGGRMVKVMLRHAEQALAKSSSNS